MLHQICFDLKQQSRTLTFFHLKFKWGSGVKIWFRNVPLHLFLIYSLVLNSKRSMVNISYYRVIWWNICHHNWHWTWYTWLTSILTSQPAMAVRSPPTLCMAKDDRPCFMLSSCSQVSEAGSYLQQGVSAAVLQCLQCRGLQSARSNTAAQF